MDRDFYATRCLKCDTCIASSAFHSALITPNGSVLPIEAEESSGSRTCPNYPAPLTTPLRQSKEWHKRRNEQTARVGDVSEQIEAIAWDVRILIRKGAPAEAIQDRAESVDELIRRLQRALEDAPSADVIAAKLIARVRSR
jgi:hypothetical protein